MFGQDDDELEEGTRIRKRCTRSRSHVVGGSPEGSGVCSHNLIAAACEVWRGSRPSEINANDRFLPHGMHPRRLDRGD